MAALIAIVFLSAASFRGDFVNTLPLTVIADRAGLVMNPDAKVQLLGVQVGHVEKIDELADGKAALHLAMDRGVLPTIPANVDVDIASSTVFGAKFVQMTPPSDPVAQHLRAGQTLNARQVTVEFNTIFQKLSALLSTLDPMKLNQTLEAISAAVDGRGEKFGKALVSLDQALAKIDPGLDDLRGVFEVAPKVFDAYGNAADDLLTTTKNATSIGQTLVDEQHNLDAVLIGTTGLAEVGNDLLTVNGDALTTVLDLLVPTTALTNQYNEGLYCSLAGLVELSKTPPLDEPGVSISIGFMMGRERYRYPSNLPKVAATGGPQCSGLPLVPFGTSAPYIVADVGADVTKASGPGLTLNSDALKQFLFGPLEGPPRNSAQIGQPG